MRKLSTTSRIATRHRFYTALLLCSGGLLVRVSGLDPSDTSRTPLLFIDSTYESQKRSESAFYDQTNPVSMLLVGLINVYQRVFSSQEGSATCQFRPSCSHYGASAIKRYGALQGTLMTGDRLLRCNQWAQGHYPLWHDNYHLHDPIEEHDLWSHDTP